MRKSSLILFAVILLCRGNYIAAQERAASQSIVLTLEDCRQMAVQAAPDIVNAQLDIKAAQEQKKEAFTEYFPKVSLNFIGFYSLNPLINLGARDILGSSDMANNMANIWENTLHSLGINPVFSTFDHAYMASAMLIQPIYAGGRIVNGNRLASLGVKAATLQSSISQKEKLEEMEEKYWQIVSLEEKKKTLDHAFEYVDAIYKTVESAANAGIALQSDLLKVRKEYNNLKSKKIRLYSGVRVAKMDLFNLIGQEYSVLGYAEDSSIPALDSIALEGNLDGLQAPINYYIDESQLAASTQESQLLDLSVEAAKLEKKMALGETLPEIGIGLAYGNFCTVGDPQWNGLAFAKVSVPITHWWGASHKARRLQTKVDKAQNQRNYLQSQLIVKAHLLWEELGATWEEMDIAQEDVELARDNYDKTLSQFSAGQATITDLLGSGNDLNLSEDALVDAKIAYLLALNKYTDMSN